MKKNNLSKADILIISEDYPPFTKGGAGISTSLMVKYISKKCNCVVLTSNYRKSIWSMNNVKIYPILRNAESKNRTASEVFIFGINIVIKMISDYIKVSKFVKNNKINIINIIATNYFSAMQIVIIALTRKPIVVDVRDLYLFHSISYLRRYRGVIKVKKSGIHALLFRLFYFIEKIFFRLETSLLKTMSKSNFFDIQFIAISNFIKSEMITHGYPENRITVVYNIAELSQKIIKDNKRMPRVIYAGRLESEKGIWTAVKAWQLVADKSLQLIIIGEGSEYNDLVDYVNEKRINNIQFLGKVSGEKVIEEYRKSKFIIAPSIWPEPFGRFVQESYSSLTPLITTNVGGITEGIKNRFNGLTVEPNNPKRLAEAINELNSNSLLYKKIVSNLKQGSPMFNPNKNAEIRIRVYTDLLNKYYEN